MFDVPFLKRLVILNGCVPLAILGWDAWNDRLGANSVNYAIHITGIIALLFLVLSLGVTPLKAVTGWNTLVAYRRALGLYGFFYAIVHLILYVAFDRAGDLSSTVGELATRRYLQVGLASIILMIPLAVTSTDAMIRRLGPKRWKLLHRSAYVAIALGGLHYLLLVKSDIRQPVAFLGVIGTLLIGRFGTRYLERNNRRPNRQNALLEQMSARGSRSSQPGTATATRPRFWKGRLKLARIFYETPDVKTFRFVDPNGAGLPFDYKAGQYLNLKLNIDGQVVRRSYTIASSPTRRDYCEVTVKREPQGKASRFIHDTWREGDLIEIGAPAGKFFFTGADVDEVVLIAGGVGITPVMSMLRYLTDRGWPGTIHFLFVAKTQTDIVFRDELEYLARRFPNLKLHIALTRIEGELDGPSGFVAGRLSTHRLLEWIPNLPKLAVYLCGPDTMMENTRQLLLEVGVAADAVHTEAFSSPASIIDPSDSSASVEPNDSASSTTVEAFVPGEAGYQLHIADASTTIDVDSTESVLEGAERHGIDIPFECRSGVCGQCKVRLCRGKAKMDQTYALTKNEQEQGWILACQAHLESDGEINLARW